MQHISTPTIVTRPQFHVLNDNGACSWFMDERLIVDNGRLIVGSVRSSGRFDSRTYPVGATLN